MTKTITKINKFSELVTDDGSGTPAGENFIGQVGSISLAKNFSFARPANATKYTAKDVVGTALVVSAATNASPIVLTTGTHGLADGDPITVASVGGNTNANGNYFAKVTGYSAVTFGLYTDKALTTPVAGNAEYTAGGTVARLFRLKDIFRKNGGSGYVTKVRAGTDLSTFVDSFKIHFYSIPVPAIVDNAAFTLLYANIPARLGAVTLPAFSTVGAGSDSADAMASMGSINASEIPLAVRNGDNTKDLYCRIEEGSAGIPASGQDFWIEVTVMEG